MNNVSSPRRAAADFRLLWFGQTVSELGSGISALAIPLLAIDVLHASAASVSLVTACETLPYLLFTLPAGAWIDRVAKRSVLITTDVLRALAIASIPLALALGGLTMPQLWVVGFLVGTLSVFFNVTYQAYVPFLVEGRDLIKGNSRLEITRSGANLASPALTGILIDVLGAAWTIFLDAVSFVVSVLSLGAIATREPERSPSVGTTRIRSDIKEGLMFVWNERRIRQVAFCTSTFNFFGAMAGAIFLVFARRTLELPASRIGIYMALGSIGGIAGAAIANRFSGRFGVGHAIIAGAVLSGIGELANPLLTPANAPILIVLGGGFVSAGATLYNVSQVSMRQAICPPRLQARMNASVRFMVWGTQPLGAVAGGLIATVVGLRATLVVAAIGTFLAIGFVLTPRIRGIKEIPEQVQD